MTVAVPDGAVEALHVVFTAGDQRFAVSHLVVREMIRPPGVVPLPGVGPEVLGLVNLRGAVLGLVDLRKALGQASAVEEMRALQADLDTYEGHHRAWIDELEASVREGREFRLTTDPHACAFGRWYDAFSTENVMLQQRLASFDEPHRQIHALACRVGKLVQAGRVPEAQAVIEEGRWGILGTMSSLFREARQAVEQARKEIAIVLSDLGGPVDSLALLVDTVESIESLTLREDGMREVACHPLLGGIATDSKDRLVLVLEPAALGRSLEGVRTRGGDHGA